MRLGAGTVDELEARRRRHPYGGGKGGVGG